MLRRTRKTAVANAGTVRSEPQVTSESEAQAPQGQSASASTLAGDAAATACAVSATAKAAPRAGSKLGIVLGLLAAPEGVSLARLVEVTGWLPHTTRAALTGLRKRGYVVTNAKSKDADGVPQSVYRVAPAQAA